MYLFFALGINIGRYRRHQISIKEQVLKYLLVKLRPQFACQCFSIVSNSYSTCTILTERQSSRQEGLYGFNFWHSSPLYLFFILLKNLNLKSLFFIFRALVRRTEMIICIDNQCTSYFTLVGNNSYLSYFDQISYIDDL